MPETPPPDVKAAAEQLKVPFLEALMERTPASLRRAGAAFAGVVVPFANSFVQSRYGFGVDDTILLAIEGVLAGYITQSVVNTVHERSAQVALEKAKTAESAIADLNRGPTP